MYTAGALRGASGRAAGRRQCRNPITPVLCVRPDERSPATSLVECNGRRCCIVIAAAGLFRDCARLPALIPKRVRCKKKNKLKI